MSAVLPEQSAVLPEPEVVVPPDVPGNLAAFRRWALSDGFPQGGRIDFLGGFVEVDEMAGEDLLTHGTLKLEIAAAVHARVRQLDLGYAFVDRARVSCPEADLSAEPDVVVVSYEAIETGRVVLTPKATGEAGRYVEIEGPPDLVVEVVSDSTVRKDTRRLPGRYFAAGVREFWLADGRGADLAFAVHRRGAAAFEPTPPDAEGFAASAVLAAALRLDRRRDRLGAWRYDLTTR